MRVSVRTWMLATLAVSLLVPAAAAAATVPMSVTPVAPADGGTVPVNEVDQPTTFTVRLPDNLTPESVTATITDSNVTTPDGLLEQDRKLGGGDLPAGATDRAAYSGPVTGSFSENAGTYYFQYSYQSTGPECSRLGGSCIVASQVFSLMVVAQAPGTSGTSHLKVWALADALPLIRPILRTGSRRTPTRLMRSCKRAGDFGFNCIVNWWDTRYFWRGLLILRIDSVTKEVKYRFKGHRATRACMRHRSVNKCRHEWAF